LASTAAVAAEIAAAAAAADVAVLLFGTLPEFVERLANVGLEGQQR
jgi:hypothetical protein